MARYTFICPKCASTVQTYVPSSCFDVKCACGADMVRQIPKISKPTVHEVLDKRGGKQLIENSKEELTARKEKYYWEVEIPRLVQSGIYTMETMVTNGWITMLEDKTFVINKKPPSQR
jgi:hypothetical protein